MTDITDTELDLDAIEIGARAWSEHLASEARRGPIGTMFVSPWEVRALVAALRSERTQNKKLRDSVAETVADVLSDWHYAHDDSERERYIAHDSFTLAHALTHCICFGAGMRVAETFAAELERERTQNRSLYDALQLMVDKLGTWHGFGQSEKRAFDTARAALSTQEAPKA